MYLLVIIYKFIKQSLHDTKNPFIQNVRQNVNAEEMMRENGVSFCKRSVLSELQKVKVPSSLYNIYFPQGLECCFECSEILFGFEISSLLCQLPPVEGGGEPP